MPYIRLKATIIAILLALFGVTVEASSLLSGASLCTDMDCVVIRDVKRNGKLWKVGIRPGDVILRVDDQEIKTLDDYVRKSKSTNNKTATILFSSNGKEYTIVKKGNNYQRENIETEHFPGNTTTIPATDEGDNKTQANNQTSDVVDTSAETTETTELTMKEMYKRLAKIRKNVLRNSDRPTGDTSKVSKRPDKPEQDSTAQTKALQTTSPTYSSKLKAEFKAEPTTGIAPLKVKFTDISKGQTLYWRWDFGDGTKSNERSPVHVYGKPGTYIVWLAIQNPIDTDEAKKTIIIGDPKPEAKKLPKLKTSFACQQITGISPFQVKFRDLSVGEPTYWKWEFGDGAKSTDQHPVHAYTSTGDYNISLTIGREGEKSPGSRTESITIININMANKLIDYYAVTDSKPVSEMSEEAISKELFMLESFVVMERRMYSNTTMLGKAGWYPVFGTQVYIKRKENDDIYRAVPVAMPTIYGAGGTGQYDYGFGIGELVWIKNMGKDISVTSTSDLRMRFQDDFIREKQRQYKHNTGKNYNSDILIRTTLTSFESEGLSRLALRYDRQFITNRNGFSETLDIFVEVNMTGIINMINRHRKLLEVKNKTHTK